MSYGIKYPEVKEGQWVGDNKFVSVNARQSYYRLAILINRLMVLEPKSEWSRVHNFCLEYGAIPITIVGSNPGNASPDCSPFHPDTKSRQFVDKWFEGGLYDITYFNLVDRKTKENKTLSKRDIRQHLGQIKQKLHAKANIVACGRTAAMGLEMAGELFFEMPHPSGSCRFWNDKVAGEQLVKELLRWIER